MVKHEDVGKLISSVYGRCIGGKSNAYGNVCRQNGFPIYDRHTEWFSYHANTLKQ